MKLEKRAIRNSDGSFRRHDSRPFLAPYRRLRAVQFDDAKDEIGRGSQTQNDRNDGGFRSKLSPRKNARPVERAANQSRGHGVSRERHAKQRALRKIPSNVQSDRHPEPARRRVSCAQQNAGFQGNCQRTAQRRSMIGGMGRSKERGGEQQRSPGAQELRAESEQESTKQ